jgi:hypothetical protein
VTEDQSSIAALERACLTAAPAQHVGFAGSVVLGAFMGGTGDGDAEIGLNAKATGATSFHAAVHFG